MFKRKKESIYSFGKDFDSKYEPSAEKTETVKMKVVKSTKSKNRSRICPIPSLGKIGTGIGQKLMKGYHQPVKVVKKRSSPPQISSDYKSSEEKKFRLSTGDTPLSQYFQVWGECPKSPNNLTKKSVL